MRRGDLALRHLFTWVFMGRLVCLLPCETVKQPFQQRVFAWSVYDQKILYLLPAAFRFIGGSSLSLEPSKNISTPRQEKSSTLAVHWPRHVQDEENFSHA